MRKVCGAAIAIAISASAAIAEGSYILNQNQTGLALPGVTIPQGYDEVRTSDGAACRTSNAGNGAYMDVGVIGTQHPSGSFENGAVYGRVVVPLGRTGSRVNCKRLYDLEIERLEMEVRLLRAGLGRANVTDTSDANFQEGWSTQGQHMGAVDNQQTGAVQQVTAPTAKPRRAPKHSSKTAQDPGDWELRSAN